MQHDVVRVIRTATRPSCLAGAIPLHPEAVSEFRFIPPCRPIPAKAVPAGDGWLHEAKFDGYRAQLHKVGSDVAIFSKQGQIFTSRFRTIADLLRALPIKSVIIDAERVGVRSPGAQRSGSQGAIAGEAEGASPRANGAFGLSGRVDVADLRRRPGAAQGGS